MPSIFSKSGPTAGRAKARNKSIRGTISAPIPITPRSPDDDGFPSRHPGPVKAPVAADDEFPMRAPGTGIAIPLPPNLSPGPTPEEPAEQPAEHAVREPQNQQTGDGEPCSEGTSRSPSNQSSRKTSPLGVSRSPVPPPARRATNPVLSTIRYSVVSDAPSKHTAQSTDAPQRKKSTLRSALGRLFGRGKKKNVGGNQGSGATSLRESAPLAATQHRSEPTALGRPSPHRSASHPMTEFDRPLRSHSIGPDDIMAIESVRNSLHADTVRPGSSTEAAIRRRAATTGGHALLRPHLFNREWGAGLSPRPASTQGRGSRADRRPEAEDPSEIGRAITSDSGGGLRRRSRSVSGLPDHVGAQPLGRRRSDEIRYWRESYDPGFMSPLSSNAQDDVDDTAMADVSAPDSPAVERPPKTPPQPFNFGLLSKEMIGMKITHAADMDMRLVNLESRTVHLVRVVDKLCHAVPEFSTRPVDQTDLYLPASSRRSLEADASSRLFSDEPPVPSVPLYPHRSPSASKAKSPTPTSPAPPASNSPASDSTVRGAATLPTPGPEPSNSHTAATSSSSSSSNTRQDVNVNQVVAQLRADLDAERASRQALEAQVKKLSERVNTLSTTMFAMVRGPAESRSQERLASSSSSSSSLLLAVPSPPLMTLPQEQLSVFETDDDDGGGDDDAKGGLGGKKMMMKRSSLSSSSSLTTPGGLAEGEITEDDYQTPREEGAPLVVKYGPLGEGFLRPDDDDDGGHGEEEEDNDDDLHTKKAARTLSLSQLTLGKGQPTRI
ncbi:hypothetical protein N658DRAFT_462725 [Parathielavia hyrcaniae]|uniref:Uncharacterized protein n=1 Tax=Parathielavia hyrcaniae TaxID=113614 RepID=A0AAN6QDE1_9PEZI|nr:hypothetical protein N658DRAFT_462725 [Parathielavia hyrcaniae]